MASYSPSLQFSILDWSIHAFHMLPLSDIIDFIFGFATFESLTTLPYPYHTFSLCAQGFLA